MYGSEEGVAEIELRILNCNLRPQDSGVLARVRIDLKIIWLRFKLNMKEKETK